MREPARLPRVGAAGGTVDAWLALTMIAGSAPVAMDNVRLGLMPQIDAPRRVHGIATPPNDAIFANRRRMGSLYAGAELDDAVPSEHYQVGDAEIGGVLSGHGRSMPEERRRDE